MGKIVNRQELAELFGYSLPTISAWTEDGMPAETVGSRGKQFEYDTEKCLKWLLTREREERKKKTASQIGEDGEPINIDQARLRHEVAKAKTAELDLALKMGLVAPRDMIAKVLSNEIANARARLLAIPTKSRPIIHLHVGEPEKTKKVVSEIERLVREALIEIKLSAEEPAPNVTSEENG
jgi:phage terminase Nu1 subunit (DNA packaging protein)